MTFVTRSKSPRVSCTVFERRHLRLLYSTFSRQGTEFKQHDVWQGSCKSGSVPSPRGLHRCYKYSYHMQIIKGSLMISGVQKPLISGWYLVDILDIRQLNSIKTWLFSEIFQVLFTSWLQCTDIWLISYTSLDIFIYCWAEICHI